MLDGPTNARRLWAVALLSAALAPGCSSFTPPKALALANPELKPLVFFVMPEGEIRNGGYNSDDVRMLTGRLPGWLAAELTQAGYRVVGDSTEGRDVTISLSGSCESALSDNCKVTMTLAAGPRELDRVTVPLRPRGEDDVRGLARHFANAIRDQRSLVAYAHAPRPPIVAAAPRPPSASPRSAGPASAPPAPSEASAGKPSGAARGAFDVIAASPQPGSLALIVGIESYRSLPSPTGARTDASRVEEVMKRTFGLTPDRVRVLTDDQATRSDILAGLEWLKANAKAGSRVYFYFSGHGSPDPGSGTAYLLPFEGSAENLRQSGIPLAEVSAALAKTAAREAVAIIDSCFSGTGDRSVLAPGTRALSRVKEVAAPAQVVILSASRGSETSGPAAGEKVGLFTKFVTEGLGKGTADINGDGQITAQELYDWVSPRVTRDALAQKRHQTPQLTIGTGLVNGAQVVLGYGYR